jgi:hypothetical protein
VSTQEKESIYRRNNGQKMRKKIIGKQWQVAEWTKDEVFTE